MHNYLFQTHEGYRLFQSEREMPRKEDYILGENPSPNLLTHTKTVDVWERRAKSFPLFDTAAFCNPFLPELEVKEWFKLPDWVEVGIEAKSETRWLIENEHGEWFKAEFYWDESSGNRVGRMNPKWTKDASNAMFFISEKEAIIYNNKHDEFLGDVTEHEFIGICGGMFRRL